MSKENFLLLSLDDEKSKDIANVVNNKTSKKILNLLADNELTETQIAKKLKIAASTVHYNLEQLKKCGLVDWEKYHYSEKGKEVRHYKLVNKYIIIAPKKDSSFLDKLKTIIPGFFVAIAGTGFIYKMNNSFESTSLRATEEVAAKSYASDQAIEAAAYEVPPLMVQNSTSVDPVFWFALGAGVVILTTLIVLLIRKNR